MLQLPKRTILALEAVLDVAYNARPDPVQARDITKRQGVSQRHLEQVMQKLVRAGLLKGVRGPKGGYALARERRRISLGDVLRVVEDPVEDAPQLGGELGQAVIGPLMGRLTEDMMVRLDGITLEDLCREAEAKDIARAADLATDFEI